MRFTNYAIPARRGNLLAMTDGEPGTTKSDSLTDVSSSETLEVMPTPNSRVTWLRIPGAIMKVHHVLGTVEFEGTPINGMVLITFDRVDLNRRNPA